jgi:hypothetical protein
MRNLLTSTVLVALCVLAGVSISEAAHPSTMPADGPEQVAEWVSWELPQLERMMTEGEK